MVNQDVHGSLRVEVVDLILRGYDIKEVFVDNLKIKVIVSKIKWIKIKDKIS